MPRGSSERVVVPPVHRVFSNPKTPRVVSFSIIVGLLLGWAWGDDWLWTVLRAFGLTVFCLGVAVLYAATSPIARIGRVALGTILGGMCARILGGETEAVLIVTAAFFVVLLGCEYLIERDGRRAATEN